MKSECRLESGKGQKSQREALTREPCKRRIMDSLTIENNFKCHKPKEGQPIKYEEIRDGGLYLALIIDSLCPGSREKSLAMTKLEESVMWANAAIARNS